MSENHMIPDGLLTWIAFGASLPRHVWSKHFYPGAAEWPKLRPERVFPELARIAAGAAIERTYSAAFAPLLRRAKSTAWIRSSRQSENERSRVAMHEPTDEALRTEAALWITEIENSRFDPIKISHALDGASSRLRKAARDAQITIFARFNFREIDAFAWIMEKNSSDFENIRIPADRFVMPVLFDTTVFTYTENHGMPPENSHQHIRAFLDGTEVSERWPEPDAHNYWTSKNEDAEGALAPTQEIVRRTGRPPHKAKHEFRRRVVQIANAPDGLPDHAKLMRDMISWCDTQFGDDAPSETSIREWLAELV